MAAALEAGQAVRISTGAMVPAGSDAVLRMEDADEAAGTVSTTASSWPRATRSAAPPRTSRAGEVVLRAGTRLGAAELGVAASTGAARARLRPPAPRRDRRHRRRAGRAGDAAAPRRDTQHERLRDPGAGRAAPAGRSSRSRRSATTTRRPSTTLRRALTADVVVTTGGVSVGAARPRQAGARGARRGGGLLGRRAAARAPDLVRDDRDRRSSSACPATRSPRW